MKRADREGMRTVTGNVDVVYCAFRGLGFGRRLQAGWDVSFQCYQAKVSILRDRIFKYDQHEK